MVNLFSGVYEGKKVLVTGHTGFKGSWICYWLEKMGAKVIGYSLPAPTDPSHFDSLELNIKSIIGDITDEEKLNKVFKEHQPEVVFHLAAQPLVRLSYKTPIETYTTNVIGSMKVYEACRNCKSVKSIISITTDKVYENHEWEWGYREIDRLGGKDPYSSSKAAMEIMSDSYRTSFFNINDFEKTHDVLMSTVRAGNVIGGGDWAVDRLVPDIVKASANTETVTIRSPNSTRPWQHVLEPLSGYLLLGQKLIERKKEFSGAFNFGPSLSEDVSVKEVLLQMKKTWPKISYSIEEPKEKLYEANLLKLDCSKVEKRLNWTPVWGVEKALKYTTSWYQSYYENRAINTQLDLERYVSDAIKQNCPWTKDEK
ncbi:MAG: CDP-glucose 4,6-dehydratase [Oligoflexia bacterium]|nr:CDP-glucose 4,6-dehydratase [Oligoflexia bacterium]